MIYPFKCVKCEEEFEVIQGMNDKHTAVHCGLPARRIYTVPQTNKDLMYQFDTSALVPGKTVNIYSRRQYKRLLKENGLADATVKECLSVKPPSAADRKQRCKRQAEKIIKNIYKKGGMEYVRGR